MTGVFEKIERIKKAVNDDHEDWDTTVRQVGEIVSEADTSEGYVPLMMGRKPIGRIRIDLETGNFEGHISGELAGILNDGLENGVLETVFAGRAAMPFTDAQERIQKFLAKED